MAIKRSSLERRWYYRLAKVLFWALPLLILLLFLLWGRVVCVVSRDDLLGFLQKNIAYVAAFFAAYFLVLGAAWRAFLYVVFGGLEDDKKKYADRPDRGDQQAALSKKLKMAEIIPLILIIIIFSIILLAEMGYLQLPKIRLDKAGSDPATVPATVCHETSAEWGLPCRSVRNGAGVSGLPVPDACRCPKDTEYSGTTDVITPGGPYKICTCK